MAKIEHKASSLALRIDEEQQASERRTNLLNSGDLSDVAFVLTDCNPPVTLRAHKVILASASNVFYAMFCGPLKESGGQVFVPDLETAAMKKLLEYIYIGNVILDIDVVVATLYAAKKYDIRSMTEQCVAFLAQEIQIANVVKVYHQLRKFPDACVEEMCWNIIDEDTASFIKSPTFLSLTRDFVKLFLQRDTLTANECAIFEALINWAKKECGEQQLSPTPENLRRVLGADIFQSIRFPLMPRDDFVEGTMQWDILSTTERREMTHFFSSGGRSTAPFPSNERLGSLAVVKLFLEKKFWSSRKERKHYPMSSSILFFALKPVLLSGFGVYPSYAKNDAKPKKLTVTLKSVDNSQLLFSMETSIKTPKNIGLLDKPLRIHFGKATHLTPKTVYELGIDIDASVSSPNRAINVDDIDFSYIVDRLPPPLTNCCRHSSPPPLTHCTRFPSDMLIRPPTPLFRRPGTNRMLPKHQGFTEVPDEKYYCGFGYVLYGEISFDAKNLVVVGRSEKVCEFREQSHRIAELYMKKVCE